MSMSLISKLAEYRVGSKLYGTSTPESDEDFCGLFMPPVEALIGLSPMEQINDSNQVKDASGKNTSEAVDRTFYSLHKFARLALQGNPNIIEMLFIPEAHILHDSEAAKLLRDNFSRFIGMHIVPRFLGYACSQKHKMIIRSNKWAELRSFYDFLKTNYKLRTLLSEIKNSSQHELFGKFSGDMFSIGGVKLQTGITVKKALSILKGRMDSGTSRQEIILKNGYDCKFASHLIRLLYEALEILVSGKLEFPIRYAGLLSDIKRGNWTVAEVLNHAEKLEDDIRSKSSRKPLQASGDFKFVENLVIDITKKHLAENC